MTIRTRMIFSAAAAALLAGCNTFGGGTTIVSVTTEPPGALVQVAGFGECESPCTVEVDRPRAITVAKAGYNPARITLEPGKKKVHIVLDLSAPTEEVDEEELPEL